MRRTVALLFIILISYLGLVIFANRALLFSRFDQQYWKDKYEQSQWKLPLSIRTIGDDGLYLYEGYRLIQGGDPTSTNAEMLPLGKYLIGASIVLLGNGYLYGFFTTVFLLITTYALARLLLNHPLPALMLTVLLATDPLITNQYALTMMDALQAWLLVLFLLLILCVGVSKQKYQTILTLSAGITVGLFSETKLPVLTPVLGVSALWYLFVKTRSMRHVLVLLFGGLIGYLLPYIPYFVQGHTLLDWLKIQKWIISFYRRANLTPTWGSDIATLLTGRYQNIFSRQWETASEWSPSWGVVFLAAIGAATLWLRSKPRNMRWSITIATLFTTLFLYAVVPFWVRYLVAVLPLLYLVGGLLITRLPQHIAFSIYGILLIINLSASIPILFPSPQATVNQCIYNTEHFLFADLYQDTTRGYQQTLERDAFRRRAHTAMADGEIEFLNIEQQGAPATSRRSPQYIPMTFTYYTRRLGTFTRHTQVPFVLEENRWRIPWDWSLLIPGLSETTHLDTTVIPARRGSIIGSDNKPLAEDIEGIMVWITPGEIDKTQETQLLTLLEKVFNGRLPQVAIHQRIVGNTLPDIPIVLGVIPHPPTDPDVQLLSSYTGVTFTDAPARIMHPNNIVDIGSLQNSQYSECCSWLYSTTTYDGITGVEKIKNAALKGINGGTLTLHDKEGNIRQVFIAVTKQDGRDVGP